MPDIPRIPPMSGTVEIRTGLPVRGESQWYEMAQQANFLRFAGGSLVVAGPDKQDLAVNTNYSFKYYAWPHSQNPYRLWVIGLGGDDDGASGTLKSLDGTTTLANWIVPAVAPEFSEEHSTHTIVYGLQYVSSPSAGEIGFRLDIDAASPGFARVQSVGCYEMPVVWSNTSGLPDQNHMRGGEPIIDTGSNARGPAAVANAIATIATEARRSCLASVWRINALTRTSATYAYPFGSSAALPVLARRKVSSDGAGNRTIAVAAYLSGTGDCRITATSGDSLTLSVTGSSGEWKTGTIDVDAEDLSETATAYLNGGVRDALAVEIRGNGTLSVSLYGICAAETD